jgi:hypothetical protein
MGWQLAEEVAAARPERPGPEWWTLMDIALDARYETRRGMPGHEHLMARGKCSRATLYRRIKALTDSGLIRVVRKSAPGQRAIYEIAILHNFSPTGLAVAETRSGLTQGETCSEFEDDRTDLTEAETRSHLTIVETRPEEVIHNGSQNEGQRVSKIDERVSPIVIPTPSDTPSVLSRQPPNHLLTSPEVESSNDGAVNGGISFTSSRTDVAAEVDRQSNALAEFIRQQEAAAAASRNGA